MSHKNSFCNISATIFGRCSVKLVFLKISRNSQGRFFNKVSVWSRSFPVSFAKSLRTIAAFVVLKVHYSRYENLALYLASCIKIV